ncbi:MAG: nucleoside triphosphate pyrophosphohydrolase [Proteobacteria bacterium]|nr:nucleoside triphosphate pyrophosphohydrolase [Pseudomonadota bacterium]
MAPRRRFKMGKLVRDKAPLLLERKGARVSTHLLPVEEHLHHLQLKLREEAEELSSALTPEDFQDEMADILEVLTALAGCWRIEMKTIEQTRLQKREERGGFEKGTFMEFVEVETSDNFHPVLQYCLANPKAYPEIPISPHSSTTADDGNYQ